MINVDTSADYYRMRAERERRMATETPNELVKATFLRLAERYDDLAQAAEVHRRSRA
ncbi:hypothetical protein [Sphingomonas sp. LY160]|uniref:hypothetical protein n=1 Tax=Sphingomonas sp. LY160 TaxID=3095342 RepID=UPI002ADEC78E|nr:hypothetical protein [Sphingomonas sp. LY160]MEA1072050.1 hypothetical protein [Sphingomonas sp. LY160]